MSQIGMPLRNPYRLGAIAAIGGALLLLAGTLLHPLGADPNDPLAAFAEYAADHFWVTSHLMQLIGLMLMLFALVILSRLLASGRGSSWANLGNVGAGASVAIAAALQAVDGVALKAMVDRWAGAGGPEKEMLFYATLGVRQIEIGLAGMLSVVAGITVLLFSLALLAGDNAPPWLGWSGITGGTLTGISGVLIAATGFSEVAMSVNMLASILLLVWAVAVGGWLWRQPAVDVSRVVPP